MGLLQWVLSGALHTLLLHARIVNASDVPSVGGFPCAQHRVFLDGAFHLYWCTSDQYLKVLMQAKTTGWVGVGVAPNPPNVMKGADIAMGYVDSMSQTVVLEDFIAEKAAGKPSKDTERGGKNDFVNIVGWEENGWTSISFERLLSPVDTENDLAVDRSGIVNIIVAYGDQDDLATHHRAAVSARISPYSSIEAYGEAPNAEYRSIDGSGNNVDHPEWGSTNDRFTWKAGNAYADSIGLPAGPKRPTPRNLSNVIFGRDDIKQTVGVSVLLIYFGQFLAHDIAGSITNHDEGWPIEIPRCDQIFDPTCTGTQKMVFHRSQHIIGTGTSASNPRLQVNSQTSFIDASHVYGQTLERARELRTLEKGKLKLDKYGLLPTRDAANVEMDNESGCLCPLRSAGDARANVHSVLFSLHTIFAREHNRWCDLLHEVNPTWDDEKLYQEARRRVIAIFQKIALYEYVPAVLGKPPVLWSKYDATIEPRIMHEFSVTAFRYGHSELPNIISRIGRDGVVVSKGHVLLAENLFQAHKGLVDHAVDAIIRGATRQLAGKTDLRFATAPRNFLFGNPPGTTRGATDLASRSIQRGRDTGIPDYRATRQAYNMPVPSKWSDVTSDEDDIELLEQFFPNCEDTDLYVGGLAEEKSGSAIVGPLYAAILEDNFARLRDGDRFWFENGQFADDELREILDTRMADVIRRNTNLTDVDIPNNVFFLDERYTKSLQEKEFWTADGFPSPRMAGFPNPVRYDNEVIVIDGVYKMMWSADAEYVDFILMVKTKGWIGIGFEPNQRGIMAGADIVIARFVNDELEVKDYKAVSNVGKPAEDGELNGNDDIEDAAGVMMKGWSIVRFRRKRETGDKTSNQDGTDRILYADRDVYTIFAFNQETADFQYHGPNVHGEPILFKPSQVEIEQLLTFSKGMYPKAVALSIVGIVLTLMLALFQFKYRKRTTIKYSSPSINNIMFLGAVFAYASMPFFAMDSTGFCDGNTSHLVNVLTFIGDPTRPPMQPCSNGASVCFLRLWLLSFGFTWVFSSMFSKTYRVYRILVESSKNLKRIKVVNSDLYRIILLLTAIDFVLLLGWSIGDPFQMVRTFTGKQQVTSKAFTRYVADSCIASTDVFWVLLFGYKSLLLALAAFTAFATRNVSIPEMRDFSSVGLAIYSIGMVSSIVLPSLRLVQNDVSVSATSLLILFVPKIASICYGKRANRNMVRSTPSTAGSSGTH